MKGLIIISALVTSLFSCRTVKEENSAVTGESLSRVVGTVSIDENCGPVIRVIQGDLERAYSPENLDPKFAKEGMKLRFDAIELALKREGECAFYKVIELSEVSAVR